MFLARSIPGSSVSFASYLRISERGEQLCCPSAPTCVRGEDVNRRHRASEGAPAPTPRGRPQGSLGDVGRDGIWRWGCQTDSEGRDTLGAVLGENPELASQQLYLGEVFVCVATR